MKAVLRRVIAIVLFATAVQSYAQDVGRVLLAAGDVVAVRGDQTVKLALGSPVQDKDVLRTGPASSLQVRFIDESIMSLRENTELRIEEFRFSGKEDGSERAFYRLAKGGLRAISGLVGRTNQQNFGVNSVVTSIGIRGSDFSTRVCQKDCVKADGTLEKDGQFGTVHGASHGTNRINVTNEADTAGRTFGMNEHFYAADAKSGIDRLLVPPEVVSNRLGGQGKPTTKPEGTGNEQTASGGAGQDSRGTTEPPPPQLPPPFIATEDRDSSGSPSVVGASQMIGGVGAGAFGDAFDPGDSGGFFAPTDLTTEPAGAAGNLATPQKLLAFTIQPGSEAHAFPSPVPVTGSATSSAHVIDETGPPNAIGAHWGRWTSGSLTDENGTTPIGLHNQFHYLYGPLAAPEVVAAKTGTFAMNLVGGTTPTNQSGETGTLNLSSFTVNFSARTVTFPAITMTFPSDTFTFSGPSTTAIQFAAGKGAFIDQVVTGTCTGTNCLASAQAALGKTGVFMGSSGNHVGISFQARQTDGSQAAYGQTAKIYSCAPSC